MPDEARAQKPKLSVVVCVVSDANHLEGCLTALGQQINPPPMEIIVPYEAESKDIGDLIGRYPEVQFHSVKNLRLLVNQKGVSREHHDELRAIGLRIARGEVMALIEDHGRVDKRWAKNIMEAHMEPHAAIGGAIENEVDRALNWAVYFCDFGKYQNPLKTGPASYVSDANISYKRQALFSITEIWEDAFNETFVNGALMDQGEVLWISSDIVVHQHRQGLSLLAALKERYVWGRSFAGKRAQKMSFGKRLIYLALSPALSFILVLRKTQDVLTKKRLIGKFLLAFHLTYLLSVFWSAGEFMGYLTARQNKFVAKSD
jgi:hypothetical protein